MQDGVKSEKLLPNGGIRDTSELLNSGHNSISQVSATDAVDQTTHIADPRPGLWTNRPTTLFPDQISNLKLLQGNTADSKSSEGPGRYDAI